MSMEKSLISSGLIAALASSLCCITPILAIAAGTSSLAGNFAWIEPARPFLIGFTLLVLGFAWYQKLKPAKMEDCACDAEPKPSFWQTKRFLGIVTTFALLMLAFPLYANHLIPKSDYKTAVVVEQDSVQEVEFTVKGMTCTGCEGHVTHEVEKLDGIIKITVSYEKGNAIVQFDKTKTTIEAIEKAINSTGYKVTAHKIIKTEQE